jgi:hypothetical protein
VTCVENILQLARRTALDIALLDDDAEVLLFGQVGHALLHGFANSSTRLSRMSSTLKPRR